MVLAAAVTTDPAERLTRYRRAHEKAFHQAVQKLRELQETRHKRHPAPTTVLMDRFATEDACKCHLPCSLQPARVEVSSVSLTCWPLDRGARSVAVRRLPQTDQPATWHRHARVQGAISHLVRGHTPRRGRHRHDVATLQSLLSIRRAADGAVDVSRIRQAVLADDPESQLAGLAAYPLFARS